jgi:recombination protein RecA
MAKTEDKAVVKEEAKTQAERMKMLNAFVTVQNKIHGPNSVIVGQGEAISIPRISTGSPEIDGILGGGLPRGRIVEIYGPEASGKSTICFSTIAQLQKTGGLIGYIDVEHAIDQVYLGKMGVDITKMALSQPDNAEEALSLAEKMVESGIFDLVVVDSVAALVPTKELEGEMGDAQMGIVARLK